MSVATDTNIELFTLLAEDDKLGDRKRSKTLVKRVREFIMTRDDITVCMLIYSMTPDLLTEIAEFDDVLKCVVPEFLKVHTVKNVVKMLKARYTETLPALKGILSEQSFRNLESGFTDSN
ncbi:MAG: hypothetical protein ACREBR_05040 [bacterium]